jgi:malonyl-CoA decarboxylase
MAEAVETTLIDRTLGNLRRAWRDIAEPLKVALTGAVRPELSEDDLDRLRRRIDACLSNQGGEVSARARAADLGRGYLGLNEVGRSRFLRLLVDEYGADSEDVDAAIEAYRAAVDRSGQLKAEARLRAALEPRRKQLLTQFNGLPEGIKFLVELRAEVQRRLKEDPSLAPLNDDLLGLLASWFDVGFLDLRRITWDSPAALLEKLIRYEAVHAIRSWDDLKNRLDSDRRCYAFFHPRMPDEPLIFVEVALVNGMAANVQALLDESAPRGDPQGADMAIFYSISNAQPGLAGVSFGDFLIKRVAEHLSHDLPNIKTFATLSPIPGFRRWLKSVREKGEFSASVADAALLGEVETRKDWHKDEVFAQKVKPALTRAAARFLTATDKRGRALDRVAHFHLSNGARVERINWLGDTSPNGFAQSYGLMVNYLYKLADVEANHEAYRGEGEIAASGAVRKLAATP